MKLTFPIIIVVVCLGVYFLYINPTAMEVKTLSAKRVEYLTALEKSKELKVKRDAVLVDYNNISSDNIDRLNKIIPDTFNPVLFVNDMNVLASKYGMTVKDFRVDNPETPTRDAIITQPQGKTYKTTVITFRLDAPYSQFQGFLNDLESSLRLVDVTSLSVRSVGGQGGGGGVLDYLLEMNTYSLR